MHRFPFQRPRQLSRSSQRGSVLMIALLLVLLGTFGITAWFGLIAARSLEVGAKEEAMIRRIQLNGVKEVARQVASQAFLADDDGTTAATEVNLPGTLGKVSMAPWSGTPFTNLAQLRYDQIGGVPGKSFSLDVAASLDDGHGALGAVDYNIQLRTYVPALNGDLLTIHEPAVPTTPVITDPGLLVSGRTVVWDGGNALGHRTERLHLSAKASTVSLLNLAGNAILPDNETFAPRTTGSDFVGRLKSHDGSESVANRYLTRLSGAGFTAVDGSVASGAMATLGYECNGLGEVNIDLDHALLPNLHMVGNVQGLNLFGQATAAEYAAAEGLAPRLIVLTEPTGSAVGALSVNFVAENGRRIVLAVRQADVNLPVNLVYTAGGAAFPRWRSILELENCPLAVTPSGVGTSELHLRGGIRTDASIDTTLLTIRILQDNASPGLEAIASRTGFVEIHRN